MSTLTTSRFEFNDLVPIIQIGKNKDEFRNISKFRPKKCNPPENKSPKIANLTGAFLTVSHGGGGIITLLLLLL